MTVAQHVYDFLDSLTTCEMSGWELFEKISKRSGKMTYPHTLLGLCRKYADITGAEFTCIDRQKSRYRFVPGFKLGKAYKD